MFAFSKHLGLLLTERGLFSTNLGSPTKVGCSQITFNKPTEDLLSVGVIALHQMQFDHRGGVCLRWKYLGILYGRTVWPHHFLTDDIGRVWTYYFPLFSVGHTVFGWSIFDGPRVRWVNPLPFLLGLKPSSLNPLSRPLQHYVLLSVGV